MRTDVTVGRWGGAVRTEMETFVKVVPTSSLPVKLCEFPLLPLRGWDQPSRGNIVAY